MDELAKRLAEIRRNQPRVTSGQFWRQVEEFRGTTSLRETDKVASTAVGRNTAART